ncbi:MAG: hypothetical protein U9O55_04655 [Patescibacteria group bacterium]|nr:hypothetical protein [Patescibacteria group bacterium]
MKKPIIKKNDKYGITIYNNDCFDILPTLKVKSIDLILTDILLNKQRVFGI